MITIKFGQFLSSYLKRFLIGVISDSTLHENNGIYIIINCLHHTIKNKNLVNWRHNNIIDHCRIGKIKQKSLTVIIFCNICVDNILLPSL